MRQFTIATAAGLVLLVGAAGATIAQAPRGDTPRPAASDTTRHDGQARGERRGRGGPGGMLLRGITLTDAQRQRLQALRPARGAPDDAAREQGRKLMDEARAARQRGDTATANARRAQLRTRMEQRRDRETAAIRDILTAEQRTTFDANVAAMRQRGQARGQDGGFGRGRGKEGAHGPRGPRGGERGGQRGAGQADVRR